MRKPNVWRSHDAMSELVDDTGTFSMDRLEDNEPDAVFDFKVM